MFFNQNERHSNGESNERLQTESRNCRGTLLCQVMYIQFELKLSTGRKNLKKLLLKRKKISQTKREKLNYIKNDYDFSGSLDN